MNTKGFRPNQKLHESKEKYRTLVEAASEGLIMLIDGKISFSNNIISKITGFEKSELADIPVYEIISMNNNQDIIETFSENPVKEGKFELNLKNKTGGFVEVMITSSTTVFFGRSVNIIIVKDISVERISEVTKIDYQKLIGTLNIGFFKAEIDSKGKFIFANETAVKILGFNSFAELSKTHILELLAESEEKTSEKNSY